jgi:uncharacterized protein YlxP (DUF503 family)
MHVGVLTLELAIYDAYSLKDKRRVIKSLKDRVRARFNVSVAEVDHQDVHRRATVAVAMVSSDPAHVHGCLDQIVDLVRSRIGAGLLDYDKELL